MALCYMVCYKTSRDSYQTYWNVYHVETLGEATQKARDEGLFEHGRFHLWTVPYNREGMTVEETARAWESEHRT